jgi:hypothetical protein
MGAPKDSWTALQEQMKAQKRTDLWIDRLHKRIPHLRQLPLNLLEVPEPAKRTLDTWTSPPVRFGLATL